MLLMIVQTAYVQVQQSDLITQARLGKPGGLARLYEQYSQRLFELAFHLTGVAADAEDIIHDVFLGLPEALRRYEERGQFEAWLRGVAVRATLLHMRGARRRRETRIDMVTERPVTVSDDPEVSASEVHDAIAKLPDPLRTVLVLKQFDGYSHKEIGGLLGISNGASRVRFARAIHALRKLIRHDTHGAP